MKNATQILEAKIADDRKNMIGEVIIPELDSQVRERFGITEPVFLEECYKRGDADETELEALAAEKLLTVDELLGAMDELLIELTEAYPAAC